jgi:hypothetical protein
MEFATNYKLYDDGPNLKSEGEAKATLDEKYLTLTVMFGEPLLFAYTDIIGISDQDYQIELFLTSKEKLNLWGLGYQYEDFLFQLYKFRNELLLKYLLMEEALIQSGFEAQFAMFDSTSQIAQTGNCEIRFYETALLILPQKNEPIRIPYCYMNSLSKQDYKLTITDEYSEKIELTKIGQNFDPVAKTLSDALNRMILRTQQNVKELIPEATPMEISKISALMKDGRAAKRKELEMYSSDFWPRLTKKIDEAGLTAEYEFLNSISVRDQVSVGIKRGLMGNLTGTYTWLLFPLVDTATKKLGNTIAMEAFNNDEHTGQTDVEGEQTEQSEEQKKPAATGATYFFRIMSRKEYSQIRDDTLAQELDRFIKSINRAMIEVNFRREPIYLSENQLQSTEYTQYRFAIAKIPSLRSLRNLFVGRVIHSSLEQWQNDATSLLAFNNKSVDDNEKWNKGD